jgi:tagatose 1,6-diphosphate aldolase GatY/KbaY
MARRKGCAVAAFNIFNLESAQAVVRAAEECGAPVIIQVNSGAASHGGWETLAAVALTLAARSSVKVSLHLDHGKDVATVKRALALGFTSIMFDGSACSFTENVRVTRKVLGMCLPGGIPVEAELGEIGGVEDDVEGDPDAGCTDVDSALDFIQRTGCNSFAPSIGNAHGIYASTPRLNFGILEQLKERAGVPLVLHGGSGLSVKHLRRAIGCGVLKVNFASELRSAFTEGLAVASKSAGEDPRPVLAHARDCVRKVASKRLRDLGWRKP